MLCSMNFYKLLSFNRFSRSWSYCNKNNDVTEKNADVLALKVDKKQKVCIPNRNADLVDV